MALEIQGKVHEIYETAQVTDKFRKREFVVEMDDNGYPQYIKFQLNQDRCNLIDPFSKGEEIRISFNLSGRPFTGKNGETIYFTNLVAWKIESLGKTAESNNTPPAPSFEAEPGQADDLPF